MDLSGYERGHDPGSRATFDVSVENRHDSEFAATVCAYLVDDSGIVLDLDRIEIQLASDNQISTSIEVEFPEDLERRAYGFAVVLEEWGAMVHTIRLGIPDDEAGPWIDLGELTCN